MKNIAQKVKLLSLVLLLTTGLSACNTIEGIGRDAKAAGDAITGAAQQTKGY